MNATKAKSQRFYWNLWGSLDEADKHEKWSLNGYITCVMNVNVH